MLNVLRHKGVSRKILWVVAGIIILSFGVFGTAYQVDTTNSAGTIFNKPVSLRDFEKAYMDSRDQAILMYGDRFSGLESRLGLEQEAWTRLILQHDVKKRRIVVSDQEVVAHISTIPAFHEQGQFSPLMYERIVSKRGYFRRSTKDFEEGMRRYLAIRKLLDQVAGPELITDEDLKKEYVLKHEKIKLAYVLFSPDDFKKGLTVTDEEAQTFYNSHKENFREPPMVNVSYVHLIYPDKADDAQKQAIKDTAVKLAHDLTPTSNFADVAKKHNAEVKESGFFTQDQPLLTFAWSPEFVDKIFTMKPGDVSDPMEAPDGWQVIKIKEKKDAMVPEFAAIKDRVKDAVLLQKALDLAQTKADETLKTLEQQIKDKGFKTAAEGLGLKVEETNSFSRGEYINAPGLIAEFQEESLKINKDRPLGGPIATSQGPAILFLNSVEAIDEKNFERDKEDFKQMVLAQRRNQSIAQYITKLKFEANLKDETKDKIRYR